MLIEEANVRKHKYAIQGRFAESAKLQDVQVELIKEYAILGL